MVYFFIFKNTLNILNLKWSYNINNFFQKKKSFPKQIDTRVALSGFFKQVDILYVYIKNASFSKFVHIFYNLFTSSRHIVFK